MANMLDAIIIIAGGRLQIPAVEEARKLKLKTIVTDGNKYAICSNLADQFFRQGSTPSGDNLAEGDLWYNTSSEELFVYRQVSGGYEWHTIAAAGGSSPTSFTLDGGSF